MYFSTYSKLLAIFTALLLAMPAIAAKPTNGKVRSVLGDVARQKANKTNWAALRVGATVEQADKIRTEIESQAIISLPDGSSISIEENTLVVFEQLVANDGNQKLTADVQHGKVRFDVQKQKGKESSFQFRTGTATAAVRGTAGVIGQTSRGKPIAALREGKLEISTGSNTVNINGGETAVPDGDSFAVLQLASSGDLDFLNKIDSLLSDTTKSLDDLKKTILALDSVYAANLKHAADTLGCAFESIPDTVTTPFLTVRGTCKPGIFVEIGAERIETTDEPFQFTPTWDANAFGAKKYPVSCFVGKISLPCGYITTNYVKPAKPVKKIEKQEAKVEKVEFKLTTPSPAKVCNTGSVTLEGTFDTTAANATLFVKLGNYTSPNLIPFSQGSKFTHTIAVSDRIGNWEEKKAYAEFHTSEGVQVESVDLQIDKACAKVNQEKPIINFQRYDSTRCEASLSVSNIKGDVVLLSTLIDGALSRETSLDKDIFTTFKLKAGSHKYTFKAEDRAGNKAELSKTLGCFPKVNTSLAVQGGNYELIRAPLSPNGAKTGISRNVKFKISNVPQQDPSQIKRITIKQNGKNVVQLQNKQITDLNFDIPVELVRDKKTIIKIEVVMKNGRVLNASKTYEVR
ncbi:MAG: FecR domain-containing protein [Fibrobacter sp.]|nr:FecR domain-containing protein [Fibrobacter sp.]